jgi:hypothetical protein
MKKTKIKITALLLSVFALTFMSSCDEGGDPDPGGTATQNFAGDWHIRVADDTGPITDYGLWSTYNAASNDENFWIDDHDETFEVKTKVQTSSVGSLTFEGLADTEELYAGYNLHITNGKILKNAAHSFGGHVVDSIYFEIEYTDFPGTIYKCAGHRRTGFLEDEL